MSAVTRSSWKAFAARCSYLQEELHPVPQVVSKNSRVKGLDAFLVQPALTAGVILGQLLKVRPAGHLNRNVMGRQRSSFSMTLLRTLMPESVLMYEQRRQFICTYGPDVGADHEADVLGERMNQLEQSWARVRISSHDQTLRPVNKGFNHRESSLDIKLLTGQSYTFNIVEDFCRMLLKQILSPGSIQKWYKKLGGVQI